MKSIKEIIKLNPLFIFVKTQLGQQYVINDEYFTIIIDDKLKFKHDKINELLNIFEMSRNNINFIEIMNFMMMKINLTNLKNQIQNNPRPIHLQY